MSSATELVGTDADSERRNSVGHFHASERVELIADDLMVEKMAAPENQHDIADDVHD